MIRKPFALSLSLPIRIRSIALLCALSFSACAGEADPVTGASLQSALADDDDYEDSTASAPSEEPAQPDIIAPAPDPEPVSEPDLNSVEAATPTDLPAPAIDSTAPSLAPVAARFETLQSGGFTLQYFDPHNALPEGLVKNIQNTFFSAIIAESAYFNPSAPHDVSIQIVPNLVCGSGAAAGCASGNLLELDSQYLLAHPEDYDAVTHEATHIVQAYTTDVANCTYWVEGLADFARNKWGVNNQAANWAIVRGRSYTDSYRATAGFLTWLNGVYGDPLIQALDQSLRAGICPTTTFWEQQTSLGVDLLWSVYAAT